MKTMHRSSRFACLLSLAWCLQAPSPPPVSGPARRALLIGINAYASSDVPKLRGCVNDVEAMRLVLTGRYGFAPADVRSITDAAATRKGILAALEQLVEEGRAADTIFVHYAGHGSQVQDLDGDEEDGKDETIVPFDGRTEGVPDITDDELNATATRARARAAWPSGRARWTRTSASSSIAASAWARAPSCLSRRSATCS